MSPRKIFLFSGHMIDLPQRQEPRFPAQAEPIARAAIEAKLDELGADSQDLAIASGAAGGDLLFIESAVARGVPVEMYLPFDEASFMEASVNAAGESWAQRFMAAASQSALHLMPRERGPLPEGADPYEQVNLWMLESACRFGADRVEFICLWNGREGDGPGGTQHLWKSVEQEGGRAHWLNTTLLW